MEHPLIEEQTEIDIGQLTKGIYMLKVINDDKIVVKKFVKE